MKLFSTIAAVSVGTMLCGAAFAGGATVVHNNYKEADCHQWGGGAWKYCVSRNGVWQYVDTPSGNRNWHYNYNYNYKYYHNGKEVYSGSSSSKWHHLAKKGQTHLIKSKYTNQQDYKNGPYCWTREYSGDYQFVNGEVKRQNYSYNFKPCN